VGAERAAERLASLPEWTGASAVKCNPDSPQLPVRVRALKDGKRLYMAVPRLAAPHPFFELDPAVLDVAPRAAASIDGAARHGRPVALEDMARIDLVVCGTVAVNRLGVRIGKGGGFSDIEFGLLTEAGLVDRGTLLTTTVHPAQILDEELPETEHDFRVDRIATPDDVIACPGDHRPPGIIWADLDEEKIEAIPVLRARRP
jgi:5-formyltetrahydrofolate cyclo-ligase